VAVLVPFLGLVWFFGLCLRSVGPKRKSLKEKPKQIASSPLQQPQSNSVVTNLEELEEAST